MKHYVMLAVMLVLTGLMMAQATVEKVDISYDNPMVTRVVITVSEKTDWTHSIDKDYNLLYVTIKECTPGSPVVSGLNNSNLVKDVNLIESTVNGIVVLTLDKPFYAETMTLENPYRIVTDLFISKNSYTYQELLHQANFYEKSKKWNAANRTYTKITQQYPRTLDAYFHWGNLLVRQGRTESALEKYNKLPATSQYYQTALKTIARLTGTEVPETETETAEAEIAVPDTLNQIVIPEAKPIPQASKRKLPQINFFDFKTMFSQISLKSAFAGALKWLTSIPIWFWIIVLLMLAILVLVLLDMQRVRKQKGIVRTKKIKIKADDKIKQKMIANLLLHDWKEPEIARELLISEKEVKLYIKKIKQDKTR
ncbi:MAG: hypothetical protein R6V77_04490 [Candidatus Cloacimonadaceae bacterium]